ncbi:MAG TPA: phytanoyl-CoA dioxygenase family protein [Burkholderiales bacterium]|nr:phytanoyl-CoA dioxygenase family protein [Burkholderiales bacterium]
MSAEPASGFTPAEVAQFERDGYVVVRGLVSEALRSRMLGAARSQLVAAVPPLEYEADVQYPGAPESHDAPGGRTVRRLLQAYARDPAFREWATSPAVAARLRQLLGPRVELSQAHHNCVMTKDPRYSSLTSWHRDIRYWSFERPELVSVWLALGRERHENGCLLVLPGSHAMEFLPEQLDAAQFLRTDVERNRALLARETRVELDPGDVLFFHCRLFHAAGANQTNETKFSVVHTYHATDNRPIAGTRSATLPDVPV